MNIRNRSTKRHILAQILKGIGIFVIIAFSFILLAYNHFRGPVSTIQKQPTKVLQKPQSTQLSTTPTSPQVLFSDALNGPDRIVTNEFVHFSSSSSCPYKSAIWDMTSGSLFIKNNAGYSGVPTIEKQSICDTTVHNNSAVFRLNTKQSNFTNVDVAMDYMAVAHGGGGAPDNSYDGIHMWVGYQNEYALYAATIFRWDGNLVIKKKVPQAQAGCSDPANDGCYYNLTSETKHPAVTTANVWHHADISLQTNANGTATITEKIDGNTILQATDNNVHGLSYPSGAVGVRGDNTEFYFKNFTVSRLL